jgi:hypothetical protein
MTALEGAGLGRTIRLPPPRGPWTKALYALLTATAPSPLDAVGLVDAIDGGCADVLSDDDYQMALYLSYEVHYSAIEGVDDRMEWDPAVLMLRSRLEQGFEAAIRQLVGNRPRREPEIGEELQRLVREDDSPSVARYIETRATLQQVLEHMVHRSAYQLKEADPYAWAIPRMSGGPKSALVEIEADEYGGGRPERMHSLLFANTMRGLGLTARYGAYLDYLPARTLATVNAVSWFGLHRRLRGALSGHLAIAEMSSAVPSRRYANGLRRLGYGSDVTDFFDEHVEADAVHENIAAWDLADALGAQEPELAGDILFGAWALLALEATSAEALLGAWSEGRTSLTRPLPDDQRP